MTHHHLAEFNFGTLRYGWEDPRTADFANALDQVIAIAERSEGFIWKLPEEDMHAAQIDPNGVFGGNPNTASMLSVWRDVESLEQYVWNTVHRQFYQRKDEWYDARGNGNLILWWVPQGHRPTVEEGMERFRHRETHGDSDYAFGWAHLTAAHLWRSKNCDGAVA